MGWISIAGGETITINAVVRDQIPISRVTYIHVAEVLKSYCDVHGALATA